MRSLRTFAVALGGASAAALALASSCFQAPQLPGAFHCTPEQTCPSPYTCDDGICCTPGPGGVPECPSYITPDGRCSDGGTPRVYFQDLDQDGYGANGSAHLSCQEPVSYHFALDGGDCNDNPADGGAAFHPGVPDVCDGLDNDCNGVPDERPGCGGPTSLFIEPGEVVGAKKLADNWLSQIPVRCLRDDPADPNAAVDTFTQLTGLWHGSRSTTHVWWAQAAPGGVWDLSATGKSLHLLGTVTVNSANYPATWIWYPVAQPWVMLCGPAGFVRLAPDTSMISLTYAPQTGFDETFPVRGGNGWTIQPGSSADVDAVLRRVEHVELLVEPEPAAGGASFDFDFDELQMGFP